MISTVSSWSCRISLRFEVDEVGNKIEPNEVRFGTPITNHNVVEIALRRAQLAILNPSIPSEKFVAYDVTLDEKRPLGSTEQLTFSANVVVVEISGFNVTDLTFVDLPVCQKVIYSCLCKCGGFPELQADH